MEIQSNNSTSSPRGNETEELNRPTSSAASSQNESTEDEPALDEEDLEENDLSIEEADEIEWEQPNEKDQDLSTNPEKDVTL